MPLAGLNSNRLTTFSTLLTIATTIIFGQGKPAPAPDKIAGVSASKALQDGDAQAAERLYRQAIRLGPRRAEWLMGLGAALERQRRIDEAVAAYRKAGELAPRRPGAAEAVVRALIAGGKLAQAESEVRSSLRTWPDSESLRSLLFDTLRKGHRWEAALKELDSGKYCKHLWSLAEEEDRAGAIDEAVRALRASTRCTTGQERTTAFLLLARLEERHQRWDELIDVYAGYDVAEQGTSNAGGLAGLPGVSHMAIFAEQSAKNGRPEIAIKAYQKILTTPAGGWRERSRLVELLLAEKRFGEARGVTLDGLQKNRFDYPANSMDTTYKLDLTALSKKLADAGAFDEAVAALRDHLSLDPLGTSQTYSAIGKLYADHEQWKEAGKAYSQADNGMWGGYVFRGFINDLVRGGKYDALWDAYIAAFPGHGWQVGDLYLPPAELAKAVYQGRLVAKGGLDSQVCGLDCQVSKQNPMRIPPGQIVELADFAPVEPHNPACGNDVFFAVQLMGRQWITGARRLNYHLASESTIIRPLPSERPTLALEIGISGGFAQVPGQSAPGQEAPLTELALGFRDRGRILSDGLYTGEPEVRSVGADVFRRLLDTPVRRAGPAEPYELTLVNNPGVNAFSTAAGKVYVDSGLLSHIKKEPGMWAAVLSHEIGHCVGQHHYHAYMRLYELQRQIAFWQWRASLGDKAAPWALLGLRIGGNILNRKLNRDEESEADRMGLMMMAEAGYHPDFILALFDRMQAASGDKSKFATFFSSDHPRWDTRKQRTAKAMDEALNVFDRRWRNPADSPGGMPPAMAILDTPKASVNKKAKLVHFSLAYGIRHAIGSSGTVTLRFSAQGKPVPASNADFRTPDGNLEVVWNFDVKQDRVSYPLEVTIPASAVAGNARKLTVRAVLVRDGKVERESSLVAVSFPKP
ncbi:MAG: M48 family metalloprotease [Bryobacterales bacterium]|nr:M48 family metalloprotease [Bryobacterales bacterium]